MKSHVISFIAVILISGLLFSCTGGSGTAPSNGSADSGNNTSTSGGGTTSGNGPADSGNTTPTITPLASSETTPPTGGVTTTSSQSYIVLAWNDLGMHCLNPSYDTAVILPPYNTLRAQVIKRGNAPSVVTSGITVSYRIINNTTSQSKGLFGQFWTYAKQLFGIAPAENKGLNLDDPKVSNGLSGEMLPQTGYFIASGIPVTPVNDGGGWNPYQLAEIIVKDSSGTVLAKTRATIPTSDEINCGKCHAPGGSLTQIFDDILSKHDAKHGTRLVSQKPVLCASCHGSPALNAPLVQGVPYLSQAIHSSHASRGASCYDCHPGGVTKCNRSVAHTAADGNCSGCHGTMANVASTITSGSRTPWIGEPKCVTCHNTGVAQVDTGSTLYRNATGHGGVFCAGCHGSPHAMTPSLQASDNYQSIQYQGKAMAIGDCRVCHKTSRGGGSVSEFAEEHGVEGKKSACMVCHTGFRDAGNSANWPHHFLWKTR